MYLSFVQVSVQEEDRLDCTEDIMEAIDDDGYGDITRVWHLNSNVHKACTHQSVYGELASSAGMSSPCHGSH